MLNADDYMKITCEYYSKWLGQDEILLHDFSGVQYLYSSQRNVVQQGYGSRFDLYALCQKDRVVISYGDMAVDRLDALKAAIDSTMSVKEIGQTLERIFQCEAGYGIKYAFRAMPVLLGSLEVKALTGEDYKEYERFFRRCNPNQNIEWLREYFDEMALKRLCMGVFADGGLVSCTDAPQVPYMAEAVQEIGIHTVYEYRGRGYAAWACSKCMEELLNNHKVPLWSTSIDNTASRRLAEKIGFVELATEIHITL